MTTDEEWDAIVPISIRWRILERDLDIWREKKLKNETYLTRKKIRS